jgi:F0F1-type ATP synthase assembly protein I
LAKPNRRRKATSERNFEMNEIFIIGIVVGGSIGYLVGIIIGGLIWK